MLILYSTDSQVVPSISLFNSVSILFVQGFWDSFKRTIFVLFLLRHLPPSAMSNKDHKTPSPTDSLKQISWASPISQSHTGLTTEEQIQFQVNFLRDAATIQFLTGNGTLDPTNKGKLEESFNKDSHLFTPTPFNPSTIPKLQKPSSIRKTDLFHLLHPLIPFNSKIIWKTQHSPISFPILSPFYLYSLLLSVLSIWFYASLVECTQPHAGSQWTSHTFNEKPRSGFNNKNTSL